MAANIDIAPTILEIACIKQQPSQLAGASLLPLAKGEKVDGWRSSLHYEYYWKFNFPHTPTTFAIRSDNFKLIQYHGIWDTGELYYLKNDPLENHNLIDDPNYLSGKMRVREALYSHREDDGEHAVPYTKKFSAGAVFRQKDRSEAAEFPDDWLRNGSEKDLTKFFVPEDKWMRRGNN
tara:strand:- start:1521 stop:2054 length:534 start_codon:yes stop_codon:yes gene_type:complete